MPAEILESIAKAIIKGDIEAASRSTQMAIASGLPYKEVIKGLISGIKTVGQFFSEGEYYLPELIVSGMAMQTALTQIEPLMESQGQQKTGKYLIGTVKGDMHDIGKNIVIMMLKGSGWEVTDMGVDNAPEQFCEKIKEGDYDILGMSALLTTTMPNAKATVEALIAAGIRNKIKIMLGGAPVTQEYCDEIGVDAWGMDAWDAVLKSQALLADNVRIPGGTTTKMTGVERFLTALKNREPDRVPHMELIHDQKVRDAILPGATLEDFAEHMDLDAHILIDRFASWKHETVDEPKRIVRDQWGALTKFTSEAVGHPIGHAIESEKDLDNYIPPDPDEEWRYDKIKAAVKRFKGRIAVVAHATDVFDIVKDSILGDKAYYAAMIQNPEFIDRVQDIILDYNLRYIKNCMECGADVLCVSGDFAMTKGPMVSPQLTSRFLTPALQQEVAAAAEFNVPTFKHTDGNIWKIFDMLLDTGISGIHPIDPLAGMDLGEAKQKYGDRVCIMGNVNCAATLSWKTTDEVRAEVKACMKKAGYGGGYVCMSSNSIHSGVNPDNYIAMVKAVREYGKYPLDLD